MLSYEGRDYHTIFATNFGPHTCKLCNEDVTYNNHKGASWYCHNCLPKYERFLDNIPENWNNLMGDTGVKPSYEEWLEDAYLTKLRDEGKITSAEAEKEAIYLAKVIAEEHQPWISSSSCTTLQQKSSILSAINLDEVYNWLDK